MSKFLSILKYNKQKLAQNKRFSETWDFHIPNYSNISSSILNCFYSPLQ